MPSDWSTNNFPMADPPGNVRWMLVSWKIVKLEECAHCIRGDYGLESRQFDHLVKGTTKEEVIQKMKDYINAKKDAGQRDDVKGHVLFLTKVIAMKQIADITGAIVAVDDTVTEYNPNDY